MEALRRIDENWLKGGDGSNMHFIFPLEGMGNIGLFMRGALSIIAPNARTTMLATPFASDSMEAVKMDSLRSQINSRVRPGEEVYIVDNVFKGRTIGRIESILGRKAHVASVRSRTEVVPDPLGLYDLGLVEAGIRDTHESSYVKSSRGGEKLTYGKLLRRVLDSEHEFEYDEYSHGVEKLCIAFRHLAPVYFTPEERRDPVFNMDVSGDYQIVKPMVEFLSERLPGHRQDELVRRLHEETAQKNMDLYFYGQAVAGEYLASRPRPTGQK
ncbi:MAG: hypothetical protein GF416_09085 [Candidatus Altiarchaeales archaeon]|nr:hypothetical protein [Candidatus Altiarchaeales archaeon]